MTKVIKRLAGEIVVLALAITITLVAAKVVYPGESPEAGNAAEKQRFYNHLFLATLVPLPAGIIAYYLLRKRYARWRADRPDNPPLERTGQ